MVNARFGPFVAVAMFARTTEISLFHAPRYNLTLVPEQASGGVRLRVVDVLKKPQLVIDEILPGKREDLEEMVRLRVQALHSDRFLEPFGFSPGPEWHRFLRGEAA